MGRKSKSRIIILDVRSSAEFKRGALPDSVNVPFSKAYETSQKGELISSRMLKMRQLGDVVIKPNRRGPWAVRTS